MRVVIRGAGDLASGIAIRLWRSGFQIVMTDLEYPIAVRREVSFSEAIRLGEKTVEGATGRFAEDAGRAEEIVENGDIAVLIDEEAKSAAKLRPDAVVDAIVAKRNLGTTINDAKIVIGVGPGFFAGRDCHAVVESKRGHDLGKAIYEGSPQENTGRPGDIGGVTWDRVIRTEVGGRLTCFKSIGDIVSKGERIAAVDDTEFFAMTDGVVRGLLPDGMKVKKGMKLGDIDPRGIVEYCYSCSDKALAIAGGVLEAIMYLDGRAGRSQRGGWRK